jgi:hypothetical protein
LTSDLRTNWSIKSLKCLYSDSSWFSSPRHGVSRRRSWDVFPLGRYPRDWPRQGHKHTLVGLIIFVSSAMMLATHQTHTCPPPSLLQCATSLEGSASHSRNVRRTSTQQRGDTTIGNHVYRYITIRVWDPGGTGSSHRG